ncbi:MAG: hypothetical protein CVV27_20805 [Candidatus Melainabacteria bacterium HGW-Melainabacteria-1]|nr:MAG: hypothetical protein CVV27_20805 [Candidatus Melainabacteria bacterium HGW-Melainabacteria-1]
MALSPMPYFTKKPGLLDLGCRQKCPGARTRMFAEIDGLSRKEQGLLCGLSLLCVGIYFVVHGLRISTGYGAWELVLIGVYGLLLHDLTRVSPLKMGLGLRPGPSWGHWVRFSLLTGGLIGGVLLIFLPPSIYLGWLLVPEYGRQFGIEQLRHWLWYACVLAPLAEEGLFRWMLCPVLVALWGLRPAVLISGALFGVLHVVYGNPSPDNLLAGYFMAWAFIKSKSIWVPVLMHAAGNLLVGLLFFAVYYFGL